MVVRSRRYSEGGVGSSSRVERDNLIITPPPDSPVTLHTRAGLLAASPSKLIPSYLREHNEVRSASLLYYTLAAATRRRVKETTTSCSCLRARLTRQINFLPT